MKDNVTLVQIFQTRTRAYRRKTLSSGSTEILVWTKLKIQTNPPLEIPNFDNVVYFVKE
jgi:hypothetical protein